MYSRSFVAKTLVIVIILNCKQGFLWAWYVSGYPVVSIVTETELCNPLDLLCFAGIVFLTTSVAAHPRWHEAIRWTVGFVGCSDYFRLDSSMGTVDLGMDFTHARCKTEDLGSRRVNYWCDQCRSQLYLNKSTWISLMSTTPQLHASA